MNRRDFLRLAGLAAGGSLAGCVGTASLESLGGPPTTTAPPLDGTGGGGWPTFGHDRANTGHAPTASGPTDDAEVVWTFDAGSPTANTSPVVVGDVVYTGSSGSNGDLHALDAASGEEFWEFDTDGWVNHAPAFADGTVYVGTDGQRFHAVDARTGDERWTADLNRDLHDSSPTVADGTVYVGTAGNAPMTTSGDARSTTSGDAVATSGESAAATDSGDGKTATASADGATGRSGTLVALDAATGERRWSFGVGDWISTTPAVADGRVYFGDDTGRVRALDAATGEQVWSYAAGARVDSSPAVADGTLYVGAGGTLVALDAATGEARWTFDLRWPGVKSSPAIAGDTVYVGCSGGVACAEPAGSEETCDVPDHTARLYAVDAGLGAERWHYDAERDVRSSPAVADGTVYLGCAGGVSAVDAADGTEAWRVDFGEYVDSSPAVSGGTVFVNCSDGNVYALG